MSEILLNTYRGKLIENVQRGEIFIVDSQGKLLYLLGDKDKITYWRSAAKPFQVLPVITSGAADKYGFTERELALMTASHSGEDQHLEVLFSILDKIGLDETALSCGAHRPFHRPTASALRERGEEPRLVHNACSGKHAALLTLTQYFGWDLTDYYQPDHPVQQLILKTIARVTECPQDDIYIGIDGCGVVVFGIPVYRMALAYARLADPIKLPADYRLAAGRIYQAMANNPQLVAGTGRFDTELMNITGEDLLAKSGADGVFCVGIKNKMGLAVKIESGDMKSVYSVVTETLAQLDLLTESDLNFLQKFHLPEVRNHRREIVGQTKPVFNIKKME